MGATTKLAPPEVAEDEVLIKGRVRSWQLSPLHDARRYIIWQTTFGVVRNRLAAIAYDPRTGKGFQREIIPAHRNKLRRAIENGTYTPPEWVACVSSSTELQFDEAERNVQFVVSEDNPLWQTDSQHRDAALDMLHADADKNQDVEALAALEALPIEVRVFLDPEHVMMDFMNLQKGATVAPALLMSMEVETNLIPEAQRPATELAYAIARKLSQDKESPYFQQINFASDKGKPLKISVIAKHVISDAAFSLYGTGMLGNKHKRSATNCALMHIQAYEAFSKFDDQDAIEEFGEKVTQPHLLVKGMILSPNILGGNNTGSRLLMAVGNMLLARCVLEDKSEPDEKMLKLLVEAAKFAFDAPLKGNTLSARMREMVGDFTREFFRDMLLGDNSIPQYDGIPLLVLQGLSYSTFGLKAPAQPQPPEVNVMPVHHVETSPVEEEQEGSKPKRGAAVKLNGKQAKKLTAKRAK